MAVTVATSDIVHRLLTEAPTGRVLAAGPGRAAKALALLDTTPDTVIGGFVSACGGLIIDGGWLRVLGAGGPEIEHGIVEWNVPSAGFQPPHGAIIVAHDVLGGFFAINAGGLPGGIGSTHYLAPDTLRWSDLGLAHVSWVHWMIGGHLEGFYEQFRWPGWEAHLGMVAADDGISVWPPLFSAGPEIVDRSRRVIPQRLLWAAHAPLREQLADSEDELRTLAS
jgi:hypothetical protein